MRSANPSWGSRLVGIEGLRAIAAVSVLSGHVWLHSQDTVSNLGHLNEWVLPYLGSGLTLFFALSGFLLYRPFAAAVLRQSARPSTRAYLRNRALRILPAYWVILLFVGLVLGAAHTSWRPGDVGYLTEPSDLVSSVALVQNYVPAGITIGIGPAWSLGVEVVFYLALPLLALPAGHLAAGRGARGRVAAAMVPAGVLLALGLVGKTYAIHAVGAGSYRELWGDTWHAVLERSFVASADLFAFGMAAAVIVLAAEQRTLRVRDSQRRLAGVAAAILALAAIVVQTEAGKPDSRYFDTIMSVACALLILYVTLPGSGQRDPGLRALESRPLVANWLLVMAVVVGLSALTYRYVEAPAMRRKARMTPVRRARQKIAPEPAAVEAAP